MPAECGSRGSYHGQQSKPIRKTLPGGTLGGYTARVLVTCMLRVLGRLQGYLLRTCSSVLSPDISSKGASQSLPLSHPNRSIVKGSTLLQRLSTAILYILMPLLLSKLTMAPAWKPAHWKVPPTAPPTVLTSSSLLSKNASVSLKSVL